MITGTMVLEGGATRGVFTSGALDYLMGKDVYLSHVIGVSAGSCNGVDYVSRQPGRTRDCMIQKDKEYNYYFGLKDFIKEKSVLDMDMVFDRYPNEIFPFDFDTYFASEMECEIVITNCVTGRAEYRTEEEDRDMLMRLCRASSSMPLLAPMVNIDGVPYLDGGCADAIPWQRALDMGCDRLVVVLTRERSYRKEPDRMGPLMGRAFRKYPAFLETLSDRAERYNTCREALFALEREGKALVIAPKDTRDFSRTERDTGKILAMWQHGFFAGRAAAEAVRRLWTAEDL